MGPQWNLNGQIRKVSTNWPPFRTVFCIWAEIDSSDFSTARKLRVRFRCSGIKFIFESRSVAQIMIVQYWRGGKVWRTIGQSPGLRCSGLLLRWKRTPSEGKSWWRLLCRFRSRQRCMLTFLKKSGDSKRRTIAGHVALVHSHIQGRRSEAEFELVQSRWPPAGWGSRRRIRVQN